MEAIKNIFSWGSQNSWNSKQCQNAFINHRVTDFLNYICSRQLKVIACAGTIGKVLNPLNAKVKKLTFLKTFLM